MTHRPVAGKLRRRVCTIHKAAIGTGTATVTASGTATATVTVPGTATATVPVPATATATGPATATEPATVSATATVDVKINCKFRSSCRNSGRRRLSSSCRFRCSGSCRFCSSCRFCGSPSPCCGHSNRHRVPRVQVPTKTKSNSCGEGGIHYALRALLASRAPSTSVECSTSLNIPLRFEPSSLEHE